MSPGTKISLYNVEAGIQRACVACLLMYIKSLVTVDLTQVSRLQIQSFFVNVYGGRERPTHCAEGGGEWRTWQSAL